jgi:RNA polymerase sigma factor for flagellar operon FliA
MYSQTQQNDLGQTIEKHASLVKRIAHHLLSRVPANVQLDDLIQSGMIGLIEAARKYDGTKGASFETYAGIRIRGSMLDEIRKGDWAPRSVHRNGRKVTEAIKSLEGRLGRDAKDVEIAQELGVTLDEYYGYLNDSSGSKLFSYDDLPGAESDSIVTQDKTPFENIQKTEFKQALIDGMKTLPEREQLVLSLYYNEELNLKEIGRVLGVSESRVSQLHSQAALRLRARLGEWK